MRATAPMEKVGSSPDRLIRATYALIAELCSSDAVISAEENLHYCAVVAWMLGWVWKRSRVVSATCSWPGSKQPGPSPWVRAMQRGAAFALGEDGLRRDAAGGRGAPP